MMINEKRSIRGNDRTIVLFAIGIWSVCVSVYMCVCVRVYVGVCVDPHMIVVELVFSRPFA